MEIKLLLFQLGSRDDRRYSWYTAWMGMWTIWRHLTEHLGCDIDVYGLKLPEKAGAYQPFSSLEAMAAYHVEWICKTQPEGPYHIAGYSFGCKVALEIAQQLDRPAGLSVWSGPLTRGRSAGASMVGRIFRCIDLQPICTTGWPTTCFKTPPREILDRVRLKIRTSARRMGLLSSALSRLLPGPWSGRLARPGKTLRSATGA